MLLAGIATLFSTIGIGPIGARLPIMEGKSFAFVGVFAGLTATQGLSVVLTSCIIASLIHFALGSVISNIHSWFPPLVTGLVILAIGLYLIPVGIKCGAGSAAEFQVTTDSFGSLKHWSVALTVIFVALLVKFQTSSPLSNTAILIGLLAGYALAYRLGVLWRGNQSQHDHQLASHALRVRVQSRRGDRGNLDLDLGGGRNSWRCISHYQSWRRAHGNKLRNFWRNFCG